MREQYADAQFQGSLKGALPGGIAKTDKPLLQSRLDTIEKLLSSGHANVDVLDNATNRLLGHEALDAQVQHGPEKAPPPGSVDTRLSLLTEELGALVSRIQRAARRLDSAV